MSREMLRLTDYMAHIRDAIERIDRYTGAMDEVAFLENEMASDAVIRNFEVIGEACHNIERDYPDFASSHSELPLNFAYEMRNAISHGYYKVDLEQVWDSIHADLPGLHEQVVELIHQNHVELLDKAGAEALKQCPHDIRKQNMLKRDIAEEMGLSKQDIANLINGKSKSHDSGYGFP